MRSRLQWDDAKAKSSSAPHTRLNEDATTNAVSFSKDDAIGVFAYLNDSKNPNFMNNQKAVCTSDDGSSWSYSPIKYWPNNENDNLSFYAYYPHRDSSDGDTISTNTNSSNLSLNYNCQNDDVDLMTASTERKSYLSSDNGRVNLVFEHQLARIRIRFRNDWVEETDRYHLGINYLHFSCNTNSLLTYDFKSKVANYSTPKSKIYDPEVVNIDGYYSYSQNDFADIVTPYYIVPDFIKNGKIELGIDVMEYNRTSGKWEKITAHSTPTYIITADLPDKTDLKKGASLVYNISFKPSSGLTITMITEVDGWKEIDNDHKI